MGLFDSRVTQTIVFLAWVALLLLVYTLGGDLRADEAYRYLFDTAFNIGTGVSNVSENSEAITLFSVVVMLSGYFMVSLFWTDFIGYVLGQEETMYSTSFRDLLNTGKHYSKVIEESTGISRAAWAYIITLCWLVLGVIMGMLMENMSFIVALNFAVGLLTSTGSQQCSNEVLNNYLTGTYMLIGIPLLAVSTSIFISAQPTNYRRVASNDGSRVDL